MDPRNSGIADQIVVDNQGRAIIPQVGSESLSVRGVLCRLKNCFLRPSGSDGSDG